MKYWYLSCGFALGLATLSVALGSVPTISRGTDDTVIGQTLSEIRVAREADLDFDGDIARLAGLEGRFREKLPKLASQPRLKTPSSRIRGVKYRYVGKKRSAAQAGGAPRAARE
jgi:hypothetical protein